MELKTAQALGEGIIAQLKETCSRIEIAGSVRRRKPFVRDIDIVCLPANQGQFLTALQLIGRFKLAGEKIIRVPLRQGVTLDIYVATEKTWATLLLIRTGSAGHNRKLCALALSKGMKLHADGTGLFRLTQGGEVPVASESEEAIFNALGLTYLRPEHRTVPGET